MHQTEKHITAYLRIGGFLLSGGQGGESRWNMLFFKKILIRKNF